MINRTRNEYSQPAQTVWEAGKHQNLKQGKKKIKVTDKNWDKFSQWVGINYKKAL